MPRGVVFNAKGRLEGSKGVVNAVSALRSRIKVLESSAVSASTADYSSGLNKKKERERDRVERRNKQKGWGAWVKIAARVFYSFTLGRFVAKNGHKLVSRVQFPFEVLCFWLVTRFNYKKKERNTWSFPRASIAYSLEKREVDKVVWDRSCIPCFE